MCIPHKNDSFLNTQKNWNPQSYREVKAALEQPCSLEHSHFKTAVWTFLQNGLVTFRKTMSQNDGHCLDLTLEETEFWPRRKSLCLLGREASECWRPEATHTDPQCEPLCTPGSWVFWVGEHRLCTWTRAPGRWAGRWGRPGSRGGAVRRALRRGVGQPPRGGHPQGGWFKLPLRGRRVQCWPSSTLHATVCCVHRRKWPRGCGPRESTLNGDGALGVVITPGLHDL